MTITKFNGLLTYSQGDDANGFSITARAYHGKWHSSDQIPDNAVPLVGFFGTLNPTDGGHSQRYSLQAEWHRQSDKFRVERSWPTDFITISICFPISLTTWWTPATATSSNSRTGAGWLGWTRTTRSSAQWFGRRVENTFGLQLRNDWIHNGLYRKRIACAWTRPIPTPAILCPRQRNRIALRIRSRLLCGEQNPVGVKIPFGCALRGDVDHFDVTSLVTKANSGTASKFLPSPKLSLILGPWFNTEFYAQGGFSFHSNDGRGTTQTVEPISGDNPYPNTLATPIPALIPTKGGEVGVRTTAVPHLQSTVSLWYLHSLSELQQSGDTGGTTASRQPSERYGFEFANYYTPAKNLAIDFDLANSKALFTEIDPDDAAPNSPGGRRVPEAVGLVIASGVTVPNLRSFSASLRLRYFGPRDLTSDGLYRSKATALLNGEVGYRISESWRVSAEFLNLLDRSDHDIDLSYESQITPVAAPSFTGVFHPVEPFQVRFWLRRTF